MTLPGFLIVGAMKAGTTTLYEDLLAVPGLWMPPQKEPEDLIHPEVETPDGLAAYAGKYAACPEDACAGDASTAYTKRPTHEDVAARALRVLGPEIRIIYLIRDPLRRITSQYHHLWGLELENRPLNNAVLEDDQYLAYSRYAWQIAPWQDTFGTEKVLILRFEDYLANRRATLAKVCAFLGVAPPEAPLDETHRNRSDGKHVPKQGSLSQRVAHSRFYLYRIKPLLPTGLRDRIKAAVLPKARKMTETLAPETETALREALRDDPLAARYFD